MYREEGIPLTLPSISSVDGLARVLDLEEKSRKEIDKVSKVYPFRVPLFYASLMDRADPLCPIRLQAVPSIDELQPDGEVDPLNEKGIEATSGFIQRYPKRGVFLANSECAMYCRHCNRKRFVGRKESLRESTREKTLSYLETNDEITEVIISGGDPLMLPSSELEQILARLRSIARIRVIRISTRLPAVFPEGVTRGVREAIRRYAPIWMVVHINHPREITPEFLEAVRMLREAGAILISQTVLLRRVNDCPHILSRLFEDLVTAGVKPYYLFQLDEVRGAAHFKVQVREGIKIMRALRRTVSGLCMPHYALDITGGLGKVPLEYRYLKKREGDRLHVENLWGEEGVYRDNGQKSRCRQCGICKRR